MTRKTNLIEPDGDTWNHSRKVNPERWAAFDLKMDKFWDWIEETPQTDEDWRVQANGDMVLVVNEDLLTRILSDDWNKAYDDFGMYEEHDQEAGAWVVMDLPDYLCGTYTIKGVYNEKQELVDGDRSYFYSTEF